MAEPQAPPVPKNRIAIVVGVRADESPAGPLHPGTGDAFATILD
jgi:hypothetical protein